MEREQTTIRLPADMKAELQRQAEDKNLNFNALVLLILDEFVQHHQD